MTEDERAYLFNKVFDRAMIQPYDCWEFAGAKTKGGYGAIRYRGINYYTHRLAYDLCVGDIPTKLHVLHKCDNPSCCNPEHLFLGTPAINSMDRVSKGRQSRGANNAEAKLNDEAIIQIMKDLDTGIPQQEIADAFGVSQSNISLISSGKRWRHLL